MDDFVTKPVKTDDLGIIMQRWVPVKAAAEVPPPAPARDLSKTDAQVFDAGAMLANIGGDAELFDQLIRLFLDRHSVAMKEIGVHLSGRLTPRRWSGLHLISRAWQAILRPLMSFVGKSAGNIRTVRNVDGSPSLLVRAGPHRAGIGGRYPARSIPPTRSDTSHLRAKPNQANVAV